MSIHTEDSRKLHTPHNTIQHTAVTHTEPQKYKYHTQTLSVYYNITSKDSL